MTDLRALFLDNPELWRNLRIELRTKRVLTAGIITAVFALIVLPSLLPGNRPVTNAAGPTSYLLVLMWSQKITLALGGAVACWRAVRRERELNTYDFQRLTRLSSLEMAIGKLFGAPALAYFVTLCLVPPALLSAMNTGSAAVSMLLQSYVVLFTSSLMIHAFALMISTVSDKGGTFSAVGVLLLLQLFPLVGWLSVMYGNPSAQNVGFRFYGIPFPATFLWASVELGFAAWLLLAVVRNIKADLEAIQLFTVRQGLGFAGYCNFVWVGFAPWQSAWGGTSVGPLLLLSVAFFYVVGIGVLQTRELVRRDLREAGAAPLEGAKWLGPIRSLVAGAAVSEFLIAVLVEQNRSGDTATRTIQDLFLLLYFATWMARDLFYLQWMKIRPVRSPLSKAFLYLGVFYLSTSIVFRGAFTSAGGAPFAAWLAPFPALLPWPDAEMAVPWFMALVAQGASAAAFAYLYRQEVAGLANRAQAAPRAGPPSRLSSTPA